MRLPIALAQLRPHKRRYADNLARLGEHLGTVARWPEPPRLVVCPEAALTGYFLEGGVRELAVSAETLFGDLARVHAASGAPPLDLAIGFYELAGDRLFNSALYASLGGPDAGIRHVHRKVFLPTYGVFDEERFVEAGTTVRAFEGRVGRVAALVCEDAWHSISAALAALDGARVLLVHAASPARGLAGTAGGRPQSLERWERLARDIAGEHGVYVVLAQLAGFEGGKAFPGGSLVAGPSGEVVAEAPLFDEALVPVTLDLDELVRVRTQLPLLADLERMWPHLVGAGPSGTRRGAEGGGRAAGREGAWPVPAAEPAVPSPRPASAPAPDRLTAPPPPALPDPLAIDPALTARWLEAFIADEVRRRRGFERVVVGLSGGVDSAVVAFLAARALGPASVLGVRMPYRTSSPESLAHAQLVIDALGLEARTVDISAAVDGLAAAIAEPPDAARLGNIMARARMITLFDLSAARRALPLGTGNKTERLFGYFTWHADDSPPVNPIGDLFKTQVWALARHLGVPDVIVGKPATADLVVGQTDEGDLGITYARADRILDALLQGHDADRIVERGFTPEEVALVRRRVDATHWKRRLPTVAMVSQTAIGEYYLRPVDY